MSQDEKRAQIGKAIAVTAEYYGKAISATTLRVMVNDLSAFSVDDVMRAINEHRRDPQRGRFMPLVADLMQYLGGTDDEKARRAWDRAYAAIGRHGMYTAVSFDDGFINHTIEGMGGWARFCQMQAKEVPFRMREFMERYAGTVRSPPDDCPRLLPGMGGNTPVAYIGVPPPTALPASTEQNENQRKLRALINAQTASGTA